MVQSEGVSIYPEQLAGKMLAKQLVKQIWISQILMETNDLVV
jgi:hypothetical protein